MVLPHVFFNQIINLKSNIMSRFKNLFKNSKAKIKSDEFDDKFGFILRLGIDSEQNYNTVKNHYFYNLSTSVKDNVHCSVKGLL